MKYYSELKKNTTNRCNNKDEYAHILSSENSYVEILRPSVMVLGGGASVKCLDYENEALMEIPDGPVVQTPTSTEPGLRSVVGY